MNTTFAPTWVKHGPLALLLMLAMTLPMLVLYSLSALAPELMQTLQLKPSQFGMLISASFAVAALLSPWAGTVVQSLGARRSLFALFICVACGFILLASQTAWSSLLLALVCCGIAQALCNPATNLMIAQEVPAASKPGMVGFKQAGVQVAALLAGLILTPIAHAWGWQSMFMALLPLCLVLAVLAWRWPVGANATPPSKLTKPSLRPSKPNLALLLLMLVQIICGLVLACFVSFLPQFARQLSMNAQHAAHLLALFGGAGLCARLILTPLAAKWREEAWLLGLLLCIAGLGILSLDFASTSQHWPFFIAAILLGCTAVPANSIAMSMLLRDAAFGTPAQASAWLSCGFFSGFAIGPALFAQIWQVQPMLAWHCLLLLLLLAVLPLAALIWRRRIGAPSAI